MVPLPIALPDTPLIAFTVLLLVTLTVPPLFERLRLPGLVGLLVAGVVLGPSVLQVLNPTGDVEKLLSDVGKVYLMFVVGLEIDLKEFWANRDRALGFGMATFLVPLVFGTGVGRWFGYDWNGSLLIGSLMSSHTLLGYPIVQRLGVAREQSVTVTVGATIFTDIAALLVLALCVSASQGTLSPLTLMAQVGALGVYAAAVLFGLQWAGRAYFKRSRNDQGNEFLFVLLAVFLVSVGATLINVDKIVGAFLAGLAVNEVLGEGPVKEKVEFVGGVLFIPFFFVCMGLQLDVPIFIETLTQDLSLAIAVILALMTSKLLAAIAVKWPYRYSWLQVITMWSLSLPQVAATLAAALVGLQTNLIDEKLFNTVIVLMLITSIIGPVLTTRTASALSKLKVIDEQRRKIIPASPVAPEAPVNETDIAIAATPFTIIVPVSNPETGDNLIEMAALIARPQQGIIVPLAIVPAHAHMDEPQLTTVLDQNAGLLRQAQTLSRKLQVEAMPCIRIDDDIAHGISRAAREQNANLIVMGWSPQTGLRAKLFGTLIDSVFWASHCPVVVTRLLEAPIKVRKILVPIRNITAQTLHTVQFAQQFAANVQASVRLLHVCNSSTSASQIRLFEATLTRTMGHGPPVKFSVRTVRHDNPAQVITRAARHTHLVVLRSTRRRTAGGLAVSDVTKAVLKDLTCSVVLFGEPRS